MNLEYDQIFDERGRSYQSAMECFPYARSRELLRAFERFPLRPGQDLLDVPSGGGYLKTQLSNVRVCELELTSGFGTDVPVVDVSGEWPVGQFDHVICAAALHHIDDQKSFIAKLLGHTRDGGVLHLIDVGEQSPIARFLDDFAGRYNGTGHEGRYLPGDISQLAPQAEVLFYGELECPWVFHSLEDLLAFCTALFGLRDCPAEELEEALRSMVGIEAQGNAVRLNWRLNYADVRRT